MRGRYLSQPVGSGVSVVFGVLVGVTVRGTGVKVAVGVSVTVGVFVQLAAVPVNATAVCVACSSGEGPQAARSKRHRNEMRMIFWCVGFIVCISPLATSVLPLCLIYRKKRTSPMAFLYPAKLAVCRREKFLMTLRAMRA